MFYYTKIWQIVSCVNLTFVSAALKHSPSRKSRRDASMKKTSTASTSDDQQTAPAATTEPPKASQFVITTPIDTKGNFDFSTFNYYGKGSSFYLCI